MSNILPVGLNNFEILFMYPLIDVRI